MQLKFWSKWGQPKQLTGKTANAGKTIKRERENAVLRRATIFDIADDKRFVVDSNEFSRHDFEMLRLRIPELDKLRKQGTKKLKHFHELQIDFYEMMYRGHPRVKPAEEVYKDFKPHKMLIEYCEGMEELKSLHSQTTRNKLTSLIATKKLNKILDDLPPDTRAKINAAQQQQDHLRDAQRRLESLRRMWQEASDAGDQEMMDQLKEMGEELAAIVADSKEEADQAVEDAIESMQDYEDEIKDALREGLGDAQKDAQDTQNDLKNMGCGRGRGNARHINEEKMIELADKIATQPELKEIAKISGRMSHILDRAKKDRIKHVGGEIVDTELAGDISRLTGSEISRMAHPLLKKELFSRIYDHRAECWTKESPEVLGKGPIVCCVDSSGSMCGAPIYWAKAVACMMYRECKNRNQPFVMIHFSSAGSHWYSDWNQDNSMSQALQNAIDEEDGIKFKRFESAGDDAEFLDFATYFEGGGTDYVLAFAGIQQQFEKEQKLDRADVVFISDEVFPVDDDTCKPHIEKFRKTLDAVHGKCLGVSIGNGKSGRSAFDEFCDAAWSLNISKVDQQEIPIIEEMFIDNFGA